MTFMPPPPLPLPLQPKIYTLNRWLTAIYGHRVHINDVLTKEGFNADQLLKLKMNHIDSYLEPLIAYARSIEDGKDAERRHAMMVRHFGIKTGRRETLQSIGDDYNLTRERVRQLIDARMKLFKTEAQQVALEVKLLEIAHQVLDNVT